MTQHEALVTVGPFELCIDVRTHRFVIVIATPVGRISLQVDRDDLVNFALEAIRATGRWLVIDNLQPAGATPRRGNGHKQVPTQDSASEDDRSAAPIDLYPEQND